MLPGILLLKRYANYSKTKSRKFFGFLANRCRETKLEQIRQALKVPSPNEPDGDEKNPCGEKVIPCTDATPCPRCHQRQWRAIALIAPKRFKGG